MKIIAIISLFLFAGCVSEEYKTHIPRRPAYFNFRPCGCPTACADCSTTCGPNECRCGLTALTVKSCGCSIGHSCGTCITTKECKCDK